MWPTGPNRTASLQVNLVGLQRVESLYFETATRMVASEAAGLEDCWVRVVAAVGKLGAREGVKAARTLQVVNRRPDVPVHITPCRQLIPRLQ